MIKVIAAILATGLLLFFFWHDDRNKYKHYLELQRRRQEFKEALKKRDQEL